jgi:flagellar assembly factor FliW
MTHATVPDGTITFQEGLPGFEMFREFLLVSSPESAPFAIVQATGGDGPSFVTIDPRLVAVDYRLELGPADLARLGREGTGPLLWLAIVAVHADGAATANLRAPIVIDPVTMRGIQVIAAESAYPVDHPLQAA